MKISVFSTALLVGAALAVPNVKLRATPTSAAPATGKVKYRGVNIAGFDFGVTTDGTQNFSNVYPPIGGQYPDGPAQMSHFATKNHMNIFRLPVGWQYIVGGQLGGNLSSCRQTSTTMLDGTEIIFGQGGPTNAQFVNLWTQIATKYKSQANVAYGVMNEPHEVDIKEWAATVQLVVTAIRNAGATTQMRNDYTSAGSFVSNGSGAALLTLTNPDNSTTNLIFDVDKYLDSDNSGTHAECVQDNIATAFSPLADWLRTNNRQAFNSETGGWNVASCSKFVCAQIAFINANSDVYIGVIGWFAGSFDQTYTLTMTPTGQGSTMQDTSLVKACFTR